MEAREETPLLSKQQWPKNDESLLCNDPDEKESLLWGDEQHPLTWRTQVYLFLEAKTPAGLTYEIFTFSLILMNVASFVLGTLFDPEYNTAKYASTACGRLCDALWFGNYEDNLLAFLHLGPTSVLELFTVLVFTVDYVLRIWIADLEDTRFSGALGKDNYFCGYGVCQLLYDSMYTFYHFCHLLSHHKSLTVLPNRTTPICANILLHRGSCLHRSVLCGCRPRQHQPSIISIHANV